MQRMQPTALQTVTDRSTSDPELQELRPSHDPVLAICDAGNSPVVRIIPPLGPYGVFNGGIVHHDPKARTRGATEQQAFVPIPPAP